MEHASYYPLINITGFKGFLYYNKSMLASGNNYHQSRAGLKEISSQGVLPILAFR